MSLCWVSWRPLLANCHSIRLHNHFFN